MPAKTFRLLLVLTAGALVPPRGAPVGITLTHASSGVNRSFDQRIKSKDYGPFALTWRVVGSFPAGSNRSIQCTARMFNGTTPQGLGKRRKGVKVTLNGEIVDESGDTLQVLPKKSGTTGTEGEVAIEYPLGGFENFFVYVDGSLKKKKITTGLVSCVVTSGGGAAACGS